MLYYIVSIMILLGLLIYFYFAFIRIYYTNKSLNEFREIRHDATMFLSENVRTLPLQELKEYQKFVIFMDGVVSNFDKAKVGLTTFSSVSSRIVFSSMRSPVENVPDQLKKYIIRFSGGLHTIFKAIPFFNLRIILVGTMIILRILIGFGFYRLKAKLRKLEQLINIRNDISNHGGCVI